MKTIYHLAISRLKYNKGRSLLTIVAIALMTTLLMSISSSALTVIRHQQLEIEENARNYHAAFKGSTAEQVFILENHTDVESLSTRESVASIELPKLNAFLNFDSVRKGSIDQIQLANGKMPVEVDEIAGPPALFERLNVVPEIGQKFQIPLRIQGGKEENFDFTITGILEQADISKLNVNETRLVYGAFVSESFVEEHIAPENRTYTAYIRVANEKGHSKDEIKTIVSEIAEDVGLNKSDISFNEEYLTYMTNPGTQERNVMIGLGLLVVFLGGMVIYSIYYVSVISNIQEMGKLKALGATKKHIRRLLFTESLAQSFIGIPCGILLGYLATIFLFRVIILSGSTLEDTFWHWQAALCVAVVVLLTVGVSIRKPLKMASTISPVEAMRYQEPAGKQKRKKSFRTLSVSKLSYANLQRNKRRTVVTIFALGCSGIMFLAVANVAHNITAENYARMLIPKGDFEISLSYAVDDREYPENNLNMIQLRNPLNDNLKMQIKSLDGVESIDEKHTVLAEAENVVLETQRIEVGGISENDLSSLNKSLKRGTLNYDELVHSNGMIFTWDILFEQYGFEIGDKIQLVLYDGNREIPFSGTLMASTNSSDDTFLIADEVLQQLITETNPASAIYITVQPEKFESVKTQIDALQQENENFMFKAYDEELGIAKQVIRTIQYTIYGLLIVIGIIGYISLINTMITSILVRKKELGILQAIGLSDKQLRQMIHREGMFFTFGTLALSLTVGNGLGYLLVRIIINTQLLRISQYEYPIAQTMVLIVAVVIGQIAITVFANRYIHKQSLVDRMRD
jgi:putative ABC transport system permease protein